MRDDHDKATLSTSPKHKKRKDIDEDDQQGQAGGHVPVGALSGGEQELPGTSAHVGGLAGAGDGLHTPPARMAGSTGGGLEKVEASLQVADLQGGEQDPAQAPSQGETLTDRGQDLTGPGEEMFLADEAGWENMGTEAPPPPETKEAPSQKEDSSDIKENTSRDDKTKEVPSKKEDPSNNKNNTSEDDDPSESAYLKEIFEKAGFRREYFNICRATPDGRCGAHCIAMHVLNDETREKEVMTNLNKYILDNWESFKEYLSFPYIHQICIERDNKTFENESDLHDFIKNDSHAVNLWMDHQWLQAATSLYRTRIQILTTGISSPRWTTLEPDNIPPNQNIERKDLYLLHADNVHFDLLVPKSNPRTINENDHHHETGG